MDVRENVFIIYDLILGLVAGKVLRSPRFLFNRKDRKVPRAQADVLAKGAEGLI
jgi:hypothetical protein